MSEQYNRIEEILDFPKISAQNYKEIETLLEDLSGEEIFFRDVVYNVLERRYMDGTSAVRPDTSL